MLYTKYRKSSMQSRCDPAESQMILSMPFTPLLGFLLLFFVTKTSIGYLGQQRLFWKFPQPVFMSAPRFSIALLPTDQADRCDTYRLRIQRSKRLYRHT